MGSLKRMKLAALEYAHPGDGRENMSAAPFVDRILPEIANFSVFETRWLCKRGEDSGIAFTINDRHSCRDSELGLDLRRRFRVIIARIVTLFHETQQTEWCVYGGEIDVTLTDTQGRSRDYHLVIGNSGMFGGYFLRFERK